MNVNLTPSSKVFLPSGIEAALNCVVHGVDFKHDVTVKDEMPVECFVDWTHSVNSAATLQMHAQRLVTEPYYRSHLNPESEILHMRLAWGNV